MILRDLINLNFDKIKDNHNSEDLFNDFLFIFQRKMIFIKKSRKYFVLCANYPMKDYEYLDSNFYVCKISTDLEEIKNKFFEEINKLIPEIIPF